MNAQVQILLATYNGEKHLEKQLASIKNQSYGNWSILARDDGSTDSTAEILRRFAKENPGKMQIIEDNTNLGACQNFIRLMEHSTGDIVSFCDQDDIWNPDKIEKSVARLESMSERYGQDTPLLTHHDCSLMNEQDITLAQSFNKSNNVNKHNSKLNHILLQAIMPGHSITVNRSLIEKSLPPPAFIAMHDNHVAFVAQSFGKIEYIDEPLVQYRMHDKNVLGLNLFYKTKVKDLFNKRAFEIVKSMMQKAHDALEKKGKVAEAFADHYGQQLPPEKEKLFRAFAKASKADFLTKRKLIIQNGFFPTSRKLSAALLLLA